MPTFYMMVGIPGSGKTFFANVLKHNSEKEIKIHSSDMIRKELFNNENHLSDDDKVFRLLHARVKEDLSNGYDVIYDATNTKMKKRIHFLRSLNVECKRVAVFVCTPYSMCLYHNNLRERKVPIKAIEKFYYNFDIPHKCEGWDEIMVIEDEDVKHYDYLSMLYNPCGLIYMKQFNSHHKDTLGTHMIKTSLYLASLGVKDYALLDAAKMHDIGKIKTMDFYDIHGDSSTDAHYYQHHCVGAYDSMFLKLGDKEDKDYLLERAFYIRWHMLGYDIKQKSTEDKYKRIFGKNIYNNLMLLHRADVESH